MKLSEALEDAQQRLAEAEVPEAEFDARALASHVLDIPLAHIPMHQARLLTGEELASFETLIGCRCRREPLQYLLESTEFYGYEFLCDPRAVIPRADTETLVDVALEIAQEHGITRIADIGTGCGIIAVSLALELKDTHVLATDTSRDALDLAAENVAAHGLEDRVELAQGSWLDPLHESGWASNVEMVVSNPPYVREDDWEDLMPEITDHEPREALVDSEADGLGAYRAIVEQCGELPALQAVAFEVGEGQAAEVAELMSEALGASEIIIRKDLGRIDRVVAAVLGIGER
ncbi:MAG: peptide chain release factor N(5)-glutamine methyltransferase [Armatimonadota bacterium]|nr:peptide chain release factor N(5)-glutamine methyltransferase [Armatimonadota bacterium]